MHREVVTVKARQSLADVARLLRPRGIRHVPVVDGDGVVGIISDRDVKGAMASAMGSGPGDGGSALDRLAASDVMTRPVITIAPIMPVEEAARVMLAKRISAIPVTEGERLVGIITETDVLRLFSLALGVAEPSSRIDVTLHEGPHVVGRLVEAIEGSGTEVLSIVTLRSPTAGLQEAVVRVRTINPRPAIRALEAKGYTIPDGTR